MNCLPQMHSSIYSIYIGNRYAVDDSHALLSPETLHSLGCLVVSQLLRLFVSDQHKVVCEQLGALFHIVLLRLLGRYRIETYDQGLLDAKHGVRGLVVGSSNVQGSAATWSATHSQYSTISKHSRHQMIEALLLKHKMHMARPPTVPAQLSQQPAHGPVVRNRVRHRHNGVEPEDAFIVAVDDCAAVGLAAAVLVLHVVLAVAVSLPDVHLDACNGRARRRLDRAQHQQRLAVRVGRDGEAVLVRGRVVRVEGAQDGALGGVRRLGVVDRVYQQREADDVGEEDELLCRVSAGMSAEADGGPRACRTSVHICPT